jgi:O-antigen/teichoic acid export membrane protein
MSMQLLNQSGTLMIGHFLPTAFAGYFALPWRLMQYSVDMVNRVGYVTGSNAAEMSAKGDLEAVARMGLYINRYCFVLFAPLAIAATVYGKELFRVWIKPEFALHSAPLLPVLAFGITLGIAAQFNSSSILYGLGKHQSYAHSLMVEGALNVVGMYFVVPSYGIVGAAWVVSVLMVLNRGLLTSWLLCRNTGFSFWKYLSGIYVWPMIGAAAALLAGWWMKEHYLSGRNWFEVLAGSAFMAGIFYAIAFLTCVEKQHRRLPLTWVRARFSSATA